MFRSSVLPTLLTTAILSIIATLIPGGWSWVFALCKKVWRWLLSTTEIRVWLLCLLVLCAISIIAAGVLFLYAAVAKADHATNYTQDEFFGVRWSWRYGQMGIYDLAAFCPKCDLQIYARPGWDAGSCKSRILYHCEDCKRDVQSFDCAESEIENRVMRKIQQRLRQKEREGDPHAT